MIFLKSDSVQVSREIVIWAFYHGNVNRRENSGKCMLVSR